MILMIRQMKADGVTTSFIEAGEVHVSEGGVSVKSWDGEDYELEFSEGWTPERVERLIADEISPYRDTVVVDLRALSKPWVDPSAFDAGDPPF